MQKTALQICGIGKCSGVSDWQTNLAEKMSKPVVLGTRGLDELHLVSMANGWFLTSELVVADIWETADFKPALQGKEIVLHLGAQALASRL